MFFNKGFTHFHLCWVERIDFGDLGDKVRMQVNSVIIGAVRGELVMGCLGEDIFKVLAPVWYNWFSQLGGLSNLDGNGGFVN